MAELTADQQAQANQLHGAVAWVYPELSDTAFWDNYFNPQPPLPADAQSSGISIGPADSSYYTRPLRNGTNYDTVTSAYQGIGRSDFGDAPNQIDQEGFDYWLGQLDSGALSPNDFQSAFNNSVNTVLSQNPNSDVSKYVSSYMAGANQPGYGTGPYQSSLIQSLRGASPAAPEAPGVMLRANKENAAPIDFGAFGSGTLNSPGMVQTDGASVTPGTKTAQTPLTNRPPKIETTVQDYLPYVVENVNDYLGSQTNEDLVKSAYESIGRTDIGTAPNQIDQGGYDYWTGQLESGALSPAEFQQAFSNSVNTVLDENPDAAVSQYVNDYLDSQSNDALVRAAYGDIGRAGIGSTSSTIDQEGYDYWTGQLESGALTPEQFQQAFHDSVVEVLGYYPGQETKTATKTVQSTTPTTGLVPGEMP